MVLQGEPIPRAIAARLAEALADTPAVLIHGPRQCGKTTLAREYCEPRGYPYISFDDEDRRRAALGDPVGWVAALPKKCILDEVQRVPEIFPSLKAIIDRDRAFGRFVLTGSANIFAVPRLSESLAGRMEVLRLHPLAQCEMERAKSRFLDRAFRANFPSGVSERLGENLAERIVAGGFPAAVLRGAPTRRAHWYREYVHTQIQRDVRDFTKLRSLGSLPKLLEAVALKTANITNIEELAAPFELTRQTIHEYLGVLEQIFLVERIPAWHRNRLSRLVKRPKLHICDTGVGCALLRLDAARLQRDSNQYGSMLETFVVQELRRQAGWRDSPIEFSHFRDRDDFEVDLVLEESRASLVGVEIKAAASIVDRDFRGLRKLRSLAGSSWICGVVLYDGGATVRMDTDLFAVPIRQLWE
ncbi:MAG: ATP-binding protein [Planctomycetes bacterium]|nr:ATP-binding protein [Planctomycetota bacterium]